MFGKRTVAMDDNGQIFEVTKHHKKSASRAIPWTPGPKNAWQRIARKGWG